MSEQKRTASSARYLAMVACVLLGGFVYVGWRIKKGDELKQQLLLTADVKGNQAPQNDLNLDIPQRNQTDALTRDLNKPARFSDRELDSITIGSTDTANSYSAEEDLDIESLLSSIPDSDEPARQNNEVIGGVMDKIENEINIPQADQIPQSSPLPPSIDTVNSSLPETAAVDEYQEIPEELPSITSKDTPSIQEKESNQDPLDAFTTTSYQTYRVRRGDTLSKIALKLLGSRQKAKDIFNANRSIMASPNLLKVGMNLRIPVEVNPKRTSIHVITTTDSLPSIAMRYYGSAEPEMIEGIRLANPVLSQGGFREGIRLKIPPADVARNTPVDLLAHTPAGTQKIYIVKSGDTLSKIAARKYGDGNKWRYIFNANKDKLSSPSAIQVGMKLLLP